MNINQIQTGNRKKHQKIQSALYMTQSAQSWYLQTLNNLKITDNRFKKLIEQAPDPFFSHDLHGNFLQVNSQLCKQLGYERHEILSLNAKDIQRGVEPERADELWQKVMNGETVVAEDVLKRKDGSSFPAEVRIGLFKDGNKMEIFGFFHDISERKRILEEKDSLIFQLEKALNEVKTLKSLIPICSYCKKIRTHQGYWKRVEEYISERTGAQFSHGICPACYEDEMEKM